VSVQGTFRERSGNVQGTFKDYLGNIQSTLSERWEGIFREHSGHIQFELRWTPVSPHPNCTKPLTKPNSGHFRDHSGDIQGTIGEHSGHNQGTFGERSGNIERPCTCLVRCHSRFFFSVISECLNSWLSVASLGSKGNPKLLCGRCKGGGIEGVSRGLHSVTSSNLARRVFSIRPVQQS
jgi:hypothetical protein